MGKKKSKVYRKELKKRQKKEKEMLKWGNIDNFNLSIYIYIYILLLFADNHHKLLEATGDAEITTVSTDHPETKTVETGLGEKNIDAVFFKDIKGERIK